MGSPFDILQKNVFNQTTKVFGYECTWNPSNGDDAQTARVHFKNPTEETQIQGVVYDQNDWIMEYREGDFINLLETIEQVNETSERVVIDGTTFVAKNAYTVHDGATIRVNLVPINNDTDD